MQASDEPATQGTVEETNLRSLELGHGLQRQLKVRTLFPVQNLCRLTLRLGHSLVIC